MVDVIIVGSRDDRATCARIGAKLLGLGLNAWVDTSAGLGKARERDFAPLIEVAEAVLVVWSPAGMACARTRRVARIAEQNGVLATLRLGDCTPAITGGDAHGAAVPGQRFADDHPGWLKVLERLGALTGRAGLADCSRALGQGPAALQAWAGANPDHPQAGEMARLAGHLIAAGEERGAAGASARRARGLTWQAGQLADLGRHEEALFLRAEAADLYRALAWSDREAYLPDLAAAMVLHSRDLSSLGHWGEAFGARAQAVMVLRECAAQGHAGARGDLAQMLNDLGNDYSKVWANTEALALTAEAVDLYTALAGGNGTAFLPELASALINLGIHFGNLGNFKASAAASAQAVTAFRELVATQGGGHRFGLGQALRTLSLARQSGRGRQAALEAIAEACALFRELAALDPERYLPHLADTLSQLAQLRQVCGDFEGSLAASLEVVEIRRGLVEADRATFLPDLMVSLHHLSSQLADMNRPAEALQASAESVAIAHELKDPARMPADLEIQEVLTKHVFLTTIHGD
jgi:tetratricopeptide (TPR) repeat protein